MTPEDLRKEAGAAEFLARLVSYGKDKAWLTEKAARLRREADRLEQRSDAARRRAASPMVGETDQGQEHGGRRRAS